MESHLPATHDRTRSRHWARTDPTPFLVRRSRIPACFAPRATGLLEQDPFLNALKALAHALQAKDPYAAGHALRVSVVAKAVAQELGLPPLEVRQIGFAAELHDIGKIGVPERLLHRRGRLTDYEYDEVMRHTMIGEQIVAPLMGTDLTVKEVVRWHHERVNGTGAPDGLSGDDIPLAARVVAVADAFDAMTSNRPYRAARSVNAARRELLENAGTQFDPECVEALMRLLPTEAPSGLNVEDALAVACWAGVGSREWDVGSRTWDVGGVRAQTVGS